MEILAHGDKAVYIVLEKKSTIRHKTKIQTLMNHV